MDQFLLERLKFGAIVSAAVLWPLEDRGCETRRFYA